MDRSFSRSPHPTKLSRKRHDIHEQGSRTTQRLTEVKEAKGKVTSRQYEKQRVPCRHGILGRYLSILKGGVGATKVARRFV